MNNQSGIIYIYVDKQTTARLNLLSNILRPLVRSYYLIAWVSMKIIVFINITRIYPIGFVFLFDQS